MSHFACKCECGPHQIPKQLDWRVVRKRVRCCMCLTRSLTNVTPSKHNGAVWSSEIFRETGKWSECWWSISGTNPSRRKYQYLGLASHRRASCKEKPRCVALLYFLRCRRSAGDLEPNLLLGRHDSCLRYSPRRTYSPVSEAADARPAWRAFTPFHAAIRIWAHSLTTVVTSHSAYASVTHK